MHQHLCSIGSPGLICLVLTKGFSRWVNFSMAAFTPLGRLPVTRIFSPSMNISVPVKVATLGRMLNEGFAKHPVPPPVLDFQYLTQNPGCSTADWGSNSFCSWEMSIRAFACSSSSVKLTASSSATTATRSTLVFLCGISG